MMLPNQAERSLRKLGGDKESPLVRKRPSRKHVPPPEGVAARSPVGYDSSFCGMWRAAMVGELGLEARVIFR